MIICARSEQYGWGNVLTNIKIRSICLISKICICSSARVIMSNAVILIRGGKFNVDWKNGFYCSYNTQKSASGFVTITNASSVSAHGEAPFNANCRYYFVPKQGTVRHPSTFLYVVETWGTTNCVKNYSTDATIGDNFKNPDFYPRTNRGGLVSYDVNRFMHKGAGANVLWADQHVGTFTSGMYERAKSLSYGCEYINPN